MGVLFCGPAGPPRLSANEDGDDEDNMGIQDGEQKMDDLGF